MVVVRGVGGGGIVLLLVSGMLLVSSVEDCLDIEKAAVRLNRLSHTDTNEDIGECFISEVP